jgi:transcriptional regulator with XRE-family HTH domain
MDLYKFRNYLKTYRKRTCLSQKELVFLFGSRNPAKISRYENMIRAPSLEALLCYSIIFNVSLQILFCDQCREVEKSIKQKAVTLLNKLGSRPSSPITTRKIKFLKELINHWENNNSN